MKKKEEVIENPTVEVVKSRKEYLLDLYQVLKDEGIRSISDLENLIARL